MEKNSKNHDKKIDLSKRKLGRLGLIAAPVLLTVAGRPAWGSSCSPSAVLSHTHASHHPDATKCSFGCSPGYWMQSKHNWTSITSYYKEQNFCQVFGISDCSKHPYNGMTLIQAMNTIQDIASGIDNNLKIATLHAIAGVLNASAHQADGGYLGYSSLDIIAAYNLAYNAFASLLPDPTALIALKNFLDQYPAGTTEDVVCMFNAYGKVESAYWNNITQAFDF